MAVPVPTPVDGNSGNPAVSADGRFVAFDSFASNLVTGDTNEEPDAFVRELTPDLVCTPNPANLGSAQVGSSTTPAFTVTCTNTTFGPLRVQSVASAGGDAADFDVVADTCTAQVVHQRQRCFVGLVLRPSTWAR